MSEQAKALAAEIMDDIRNSGGADAELAAVIAERIDAAFAPPCPDCGAAFKPSAKWACGSWSEGGARQIAAKCVQRQLAEAEKTIAARDEEIVQLQSFGKPDEPHGPAAHVAELAADLADFNADRDGKQPPDAMQ